MGVGSRLCQPPRAGHGRTGMGGAQEPLTGPHQWDPERDLHHRPLEHRAIQIGLSGEAVRLYTGEWIQRVTDVTPLAHRICALVQEEGLDEAMAALPIESAYTPA